jgi:hypothetical protein
MKRKSKRKTPSKQHGGGLSFNDITKISKKFQKIDKDFKLNDEVFKKKSVQKFLKQQGIDKSNTGYQYDIIKGLQVYSRKMNTAQALNKLTNDKIDKKDLRLRLVESKTLKNGQVRNYWFDNKSNKRVKGKEVRDIVFKSITAKLIDKIVEKENISYPQAKKLLKSKTKKEKFFTVFNSYYYG